jgi:hypothetical protein
VSRAATVGVAIGGTAAVGAGATIWLVLSDPGAVANVLAGGEISPLVLQLVDVLYAALVRLFGYL